MCSMSVQVDSDHAPVVEVLVEPEQHIVRVVAVKHTQRVVAQPVLRGRLTLSAATRTAAGQRLQRDAARHRRQRLAVAEGGGGIVHVLLIACDQSEYGN